MLSASPAVPASSPPSDSLATLGMDDIFSDLESPSVVSMLSASMVVPASSPPLGSFSDLTESSSTTAVSSVIILSAATSGVARLTRASSPVVSLFLRCRARRRLAAPLPRRLKSAASATSLFAARRARAKVNAVVEYFILIVFIGRSLDVFSYAVVVLSVLCDGAESLSLGAVKRNCEPKQRREVHVS